MLRSLKRSWCAFLGACVLLIGAAGAAYAMRVSPMVIEMETTGGSAVARIEVQNVNRGNLAFETRIYRMTYDEAGNIVETPADDKFLVFPPQGVLAAGGRQVIRLQWVGDPNPETSEAFYVSINQLPVEFSPSSTESVAAQVQLLYNMRALVVVAPPGARPDVRAAAARPITYQAPPEPGAEPGPAREGVEVTLRNTGRRHAMMANFGWRLEGMDKQGQRLRVDIAPEELIRAVGTGYVPALGARTFRLPVDGFGPQPIRLSFIQ